MNDLHLSLLASPEWMSYLKTDLMPWVLGTIDLGDDVLEIGPGPGLTTELLRTRTKRLTALEIDDVLAADLAQRLGDTNVTVHHGDATASGLPDHAFSAAPCFTMLHHVPTSGLQDRLFAEVYRMLRPGGRFVGTDATDSPSLRELHVDDIFVPVEAADLPDRLARVGFSGAVVDQQGDRLRFSAQRPS